ncbi:MAG: helix-turn-helix transcriptional regulator [Acidobacteria bacterium]|nr:helix-turn-helix transcriptional regulator [Acidobacteriota bacterium]
MGLDLKLSYTAAAILKAVSSGRCYGFEIMEAIGLPSGTVYPALRRLESGGAISSQWERESIAQSEQRPPRKYYRLTRDGQQLLAQAGQRYRLPEFEETETR